MPDSDIDDPTRRAILRGVAATLGVSVAGTAAGHPGAGDHDDARHPHPEIDQENVGWRGYHSLGGRGSESPYGDPENPHYGGVSEMKVQDDLAFVGVLSSQEPTPDRGLAILDVSQYTRADSKEELEDAEMFLLSYVPNENNAVSVMDVKLSDDGRYAFISKQPVAAVYEAVEVRTDPSNLGNSPEAGALQAVDVSDPANPEIVGRWDGWAFGPHNADHLRIGGTDYVFGVKGPIGENAGVYVVRFDRDTGNMALVNYWLDGENFGAGELDDPTKGQYPTSGYDYYVHDIRVERDPQTGWPVAYVAHLNNGAWVLDASDPRELRTLGTFDMYRSHEIWPLTVTDADGEPRRVFVTGQENPSSDWQDELEGVELGSHGQNIDGDTGWLYLVDAQELDPGEQDGPVDLGTAEEHDSYDPDEDDPAAAKWQLSDDVEFENYTLSLHNVEPFEVEVPRGNSPNSRTDVRQFVAAGNYHAGIRLLEFTEVFRDDVDVDYIGNDNEAWGDPPSNGDDGFGQVAYFRSHAKDVPEESKMETLSEATPNFWCAVEENGVVFGSGINTGAYAITLDDPDVPVGRRVPVDIDVERAETTSVFLGGGTVAVELTVDADEEVLIRDRAPAEWEVYDYGDEHVASDVGDGTLVEFAAPVEPGDDEPSRTYYAGVGEDGTATVGPVEYSVDGGDSWRVVAGTVDSSLVVGDETPL